MKELGINMEAMRILSLSEDKELAEYAANLIEKEGYKTAECPAIDRIPDIVVSQMYHSNDDFLIRKSKETAIHQEKEYIHFIINRYFPEYEQKYSDDLFQCGAIGIIKSLELYDGSTKLNTYSRKYMIHEITDYLNYINGIPSPHFARLQKKILEAEGKNAQVSDDELSKMTGNKKWVVYRERLAMRAAEFTFLDEKNECDDIPTPEYSMEDQIINRFILSQAIQYIKTFSQLEQDILWMRIVDNMTYTKISAIVGFNRQKVRGYYQSAIRELQKMLFEK